MIQPQLMAEFRIFQLDRFWKPGANDAHAFARQRTAKRLVQKDRLQESLAEFSVVVPAFRHLRVQRHPVTLVEIGFPSLADFNPGPLLRLLPFGFGQWVNMAALTRQGQLGERRVRAG